MLFWITLLYAVSVPTVLWLHTEEDPDESSQFTSLIDKATDGFPSYAWMFRPVGWLFNRVSLVVISPIVLAVTVVAIPFVVLHELLRQRKSHVHRR